MTADFSAFLPFHADELRAQALAGGGAGRAPIRSLMPDQHRAFFAGLDLLFVATLDTAGWPVASVLSGPRGFIDSPDAATLRIAARPAANDPAAAGWAAGGSVGALGLDFATRRRNRVNGQLVAQANGLAVRVAQSFGNCPQYIQSRAPRAVDRRAGPAEAAATLDDEARSVIASADTFFVASRARAELGTLGGLDLSHRGGRPGFVGVHGNTLAIPDFRGNRFFNTLGNLLGDDRAGLLFVDFERGDLLQMQGRVAIDWHPAGAPAGAERLWRLSVERVWRRRAALPFDWTFGSWAPTSLATGVW
ncbi:MAG: pyridoxamine 5'-phosphate oxidase family protein [Reyranellaceae bacterium]